MIVTPGAPKMIDEVKVEFLQLQHTETENALIRRFLRYGILITQDLIYHGIRIRENRLSTRGWSGWLFIRLFLIERFFPATARPR